MTVLAGMQNITDGLIGQSRHSLHLLPVADQSAYRDSVYHRNLLSKSAGIYLVMLLLVIYIINIDD